MTVSLSRWMLVLFLGLWGLSEGPIAHAQPALPPDAPQALQQFDTDYSQSTIDLSTLRSGGPPKDGIPSIDDPSFVSVDAAQDWIAPKEPIIVIEQNGVAKGYPLQILTHHEIVNDEIGGTPVAVTFCPLCYSSIAFRQCAENVPDAHVLSRETGYSRPYGQNPYAGYDNVDESPFLYDGPTDDRLPPKEKVITVSLDDTHKAYPHSVTKQKRVVHDTVGDRSLVVFHAPGAVSALDARRIADSKEDGSTGVFDRRVDGQTLTFTYAGDGRFKDKNTGSTWTVAGRAVEGPLKGTQLERIAHGNYFSFAWFAFRPETAIYSPSPNS